jgi:hypothetical protein
MHKGPRYSVAGIGVGSPNREIVDATVFQWLKIGRATDDSGGTFYSFSGPQAQICSAVIIARLFDSYIPRFLQRHDVQWDLAKEWSRRVSEEDSYRNTGLYHALEPLDLIRRANRMYGPNSESVERINETHRSN